MIVPSSASGTAADGTGRSTGRSRRPEAGRQRCGPAGSAPRTRRGVPPACPSLRGPASDRAGGSGRAVARLGAGAAATCAHRMCPPAAGATVPAGPAGQSPPPRGMSDGVRAPAPHKHRGAAGDRFLIGWSARHRCAARSRVMEGERPRIGGRYEFRVPRLPIPRDCATESGPVAGSRVGGGQLDRKRRQHQQPGLRRWDVPARVPTL